MKVARSEDGTCSELTVGDRVQQTLEPCVILMKEMISEYADLWKEREGIYSLAQVSDIAEKIRTFLKIECIDTDHLRPCPLHLWYLEFRVSCIGNRLRWYIPL